MTNLLKTNDLKKGTRVLLANGWYATLADNAKGNTRMATVEGFVTETGSVYAHDIVQAYDLQTPRHLPRWLPQCHEHTRCQSR